MAERVVIVSLVAQVANYVAGMEAASRATAKAGTEAEKAKAKLDQQTQAMTKVGAGLVAIGTLAALGVGLAIKKFADFDAAMSNVKASTHESAANMGLLRDAAIEAGARTVFSATEAAGAIDELAKAGVSTGDVLKGGLAGALSLASAGGLGVADAASIAATALTQFKLKGADIPHVADLLAAGAGKAQGSVDDLGQALKQGGLVASQAGLTIEDTTGTLAAFAAAGLIGSDAGTSFKTMLLSLERPSTTAQAALDQYGISVYDSQGKMLDMAGVAGQLKDKLGGLTDEQRNSTLATIFGTDAVRAASVLYDNGADGIQKWNDKVNDAGYAAETARLKLDNLNGDLEQLGGSFDTVLIKSGSVANDMMRGMVQTATDLLNAFGGAPPIVQQAALGLGVVTAAVGLTGGAFLLGVPKIAAFQVALATLATSEMPGVAGAAVRMQGAIGKAGSALGATAKFLTGPWGLAIAAAAVGVALLSRYLDGLKASSEEVGNSITTASSAAQIFATVGKGREASSWQNVTAQLKDLPKVLQASADQAGNLFARFDSTNFGAFNALKDIGTQLGTLASTDLPGAQKAFRQLTDETDGSEKSQWRLLNTMPGYKDALTAQATTLGINVTSTDEAANKTALLALAFGDAAPVAGDAAGAYKTAADKAAELESNLSTLLGTINKANGVGQDAVSTNAAYRQTLADVADTIAKAKAGTEGYSLGIDQNTAAGSKNADMLRGQAADSQAAALAQFNLDGNTKNYQASLDAGRKKLVDNAVLLGASKDEANKLADAVYRIPSAKEIKLIADAAAAQAVIDKFMFRNDGRRVNLIVDGVAGRQVNGSDVSAHANGGIEQYASGGFASGIYAGRAGGIHKFAEPETRWEAYISGKPGQEARNRGIALAALSKLGGYQTAPQYAPQNSGGGGGSAAGAAPIIQRVTETIILQADGRNLASAIRTYDRGLS